MTQKADLTLIVMDENKKRQLNKILVMVFHVIRGERERRVPTAVKGRRKIKNAITEKSDD